MSQFECKNGHLMTSGMVRCIKCGSRVHYMDGLSSAAWAKIEREGDSYEEESNKEDCEETCKKESEVENE